ncbi:hypothetical protein [Microbacterium sp. LWS13-1.2]|uniref:MotA/TolQ/ExbB proton channel domain-containing protein n=1 Tax=Microbacterium sp. LWS13-1.2 TaxID=3135264 RepID=A0AAU6SEP0_9MICO
METALSWIEWPTSTWLDWFGDWLGGVVVLARPATWVLGVAVVLMLVLSIVANRWSIELAFETQVKPELLGRALMRASNDEHDLLWSNSLRGTSQDRVLEASAKVRAERRFGPVTMSAKAFLSGAFIALGCIPVAGIVAGGFSAIWEQGAVTLLLLLWGVALWWAIEATLSFLRRQQQASLAHVAASKP